MRCPGKRQDNVATSPYFEWHRPAMLLDVDPKVDYAFKRIFGVPAHAPILMDLLQAVLDFPPGHRIAELEIQNPFNEKEFEDDKMSVVDIQAKDQAGRLFNVEMQMLASATFTRRILGSRFGRATITVCCSPLIRSVLSMTGCFPIRPVTIPSSVCGMRRIR